MPNIEVAGKSYETDEEGYLINLAEWNTDIANYMAQTENITMTDSHWEVVNFLREYFEEYQIAPAVRVLTKAIGPSQPVVFNSGLAIGIYSWRASFLRSCFTSLRCCSS